VEWSLDGPLPNLCPVIQLLAHGRWFSPGTPASSTTKTGRHDIVEILLKVALKLQKSINLFLLTTVLLALHLRLLPRRIGDRLVLVLIIKP
jgi:hypothetical protein